MSGRQWWSRPLQVELPGRRVPTAVSLPITALRGPARVAAWLIPVVLMVVGITMALIAARPAERAGTEAIGSFGVEAGAALWFGGAVTLGLRRGPTVLRAAALLATALGGMALIGLAWYRDWTGAGLSLAMEFGVGALAVAVIDVVLLGVIHQRIDDFAQGTDDSVVTLELARSWHLIDVHSGPPTAAPAPEGDEPNR